jgi:hypothetical protein
MMLEHVREKQPTYLLGRGTILVGRKCVILLNRSTTTMMASKPLDGGKLTMKSMDTLSHSPSGIGNGRNNPTCFLLSVRFCW